MKSFFIMMLLLFLTIGCNEVNKKKSAQNDSPGSVERIDNFQSEYVSSRNIDIWLPEGYDVYDSYPVLYMHGGQMLFDSTTTWNKQEWGVDEVLKYMIKENKIRKSIVVGIWNSEDDNNEDYFPQKPFERL
ncbi:MAG: alpha/beta hydrolase-fold protein, partial [Bacteroidales bacterium]|nr:alpha/beta hydrolase-fold protein [Bacteroidales bacterium]